jgi:hypothetical protein
LLAVALSAVLASLAGTPAVSMGASGPAVNGESVSHVSEHTATLEAQVDPEGLETKYEFTAVGGDSLKTEPETVPLPDNQATPYESTIDPSVAQSAAEASAQQVAQHQREQEEREAKEKEATQPARGTVGVVCRVPRLKGDSLAHARTALIRNHCKVGLVTRPHRSPGRLVVVAQSHPHGAKLPKGSAVALRLAP